MKPAALCALQNVVRQIWTSYLSLTHRPSQTPADGHSCCRSSQTLRASTRSARMASGWHSFSTPIGRLPQSNLADTTTPTASARPSPELVSWEADRTSKPGWTRLARCSADRGLAPKWRSSSLTNFGAAQLSRRRQPQLWTVASFWSVSGSQGLLDSFLTAPRSSHCSRTVW